MEKELIDLLKKSISYRHERQLHIQLLKEAICYAYGRAEFANENGISYVMSNFEGVLTYNEEFELTSTNSEVNTIIHYFRGIVSLDELFSSLSKSGVSLEEFNKGFEVGSIGTYEVAEDLELIYTKMFNLLCEIRRFKRMVDNSYSLGSFIK